MSRIYEDLERAKKLQKIPVDSIDIAVEGLDSFAEIKDFVQRYINHVWKNEMKSDGDPRDASRKLSGALGNYLRDKSYEKYTLWHLVYWGVRTDVFKPVTTSYRRPMFSMQALEGRASKA